MILPEILGDDVVVDERLEICVALRSFRYCALWRGEAGAEQRKDIKGNSLWFGNLRNDSRASTGLWVGIPFFFVGSRVVLRLSWMRKEQRRLAV